MTITMTEEGSRFGCRSGAIIYNEEKTKILLENQDGRYMFPGGRIDVHEDSDKAIVRELQEELNISISLSLKYVLEMFLESPRTKYHEIGFYFLSIVEEKLVKNECKSLDGEGVFEWVPVNDLENFKILAKPIQQKIIHNEIVDDKLEHILYREY